MTWSRTRILSWVGKITLYILLLFTAFLILMPLVVVASTAFKPDDQIYEFPMRIIPRTPTLENFGKLAQNFPRYIWNSCKLTF